MIFNLFSKKANDTKLLVFLGNPGDKYKKTRHNAGFLLADFWHQEEDFSPFKLDKKFKAEISTGHIKQQKIILLKPQTFMNLSGASVLTAQKFHKIKSKNILICHDDKDLTFGTIRFKESGGHGGHKGIMDIIHLLGTKDLARLKIGVENRIANSKMNTADFVLSKFNTHELETLHQKIFPEAIVKIKDFLLT